MIYSVISHLISHMPNGFPWIRIYGTVRSFELPLALCFSISVATKTGLTRAFGQLFLHLCESPRKPLQLCRLNRTQLQIQKGCKAGRDPGVQFARIYIRDQLRHGISHRNRIVQFGQRIGTFGGWMMLAPSPDSAELRGLVRTGVKEA